MNPLIITVLIVVLTSACTPTNMPDDLYPDLTSFKVELELCSSEGYIDDELKVITTKAIDYQISKWWPDVERLENELKYQRSIVKVTPRLCEVVIVKADTTLKRVAVSREFNGNILTQGMS